MPDPVELRQQRAQLIHDARALLDKADEEKRDLTAEENQHYEDIMSDAGDLKRQFEREEQLRGVEGDLQTVPTTHLTMDPNGEVRETEVEETEPETREAFRSWLREPTRENAAEYRALQQDNATQAGYLMAPEQFMAELIKDLDDIHYIRQRARKFQVKGAHTMGFPKRTNRMATFAWGSELGTPTADSTLAFGKREFVPHPYNGELLVSRDLLQNSAINVDALVREDLAYDAGESQEEAFMEGTGSNQPLGLFTASDDGISTSRDASTGNTTTSMTFDGLTEAKYTLKAGYRRNGTWLFHRDALKQLQKLKNGEGDYVWRESVRAGEPDRLMGLPVLESEYVPNTFTTGLYVGLLGDFRWYWIVDSTDFELRVLDELYARTRQVDFLYHGKLDAMPVLEEAFVRVKLA